MRAIKVFNQSQWLTSGASSYYDRDAGITREIDIEAHVMKAEVLSNGKNLECFYMLIAEVKKSKHPWIVVKNKTSWDALHVDAWQNHNFL